MVTTQAMPLVTPTTTGSATWANPVLRRTPHLVPALPPAPRPYARLWSANLRLPHALPHRQFPGLQLTVHCRRGQPGPADCKPGRERARRRLILRRTAGRASADGLRRVEHLRPARSLPEVRRTTRCRALGEPDLSGRPTPVSTAPQVLPAAHPVRPRGLMTTGPKGRSVPESHEMARPARCRPVPLLVGTSGRTESGARWSSWRAIRAPGPHRRPVPRRRPARCQRSVRCARRRRCSTKPAPARARVLRCERPFRPGGGGAAPRLASAGRPFR